MGLIWKKGQGVKDLPNNLEEAKKVFLSQERRFQQDPQTSGGIRKNLLQLAERRVLRRNTQGIVGKGILHPSFYGDPT